jgi:F-type H+-transporting ATPase subunit epsilon
VQVLTPEGEVFNEEVEMVSTRTALGLIAILARHEPLLATLEPTELRLYRSESENRALLLVEEAISPEQLDRSLFDSKLGEARAAADGAEEDSEERARALRDAKRYEAFLTVEP